MSHLRSAALAAPASPRSSRASRMRSTWSGRCGEEESELRQVLDLFTARHPRRRRYSISRRIVDPWRRRWPIPVGREHRRVAAHPLAEEVLAARQLVPARRRLCVLGAERIVGDLDLDLELLRRRRRRIDDPRRHAVDHARVLRVELESGHPAVAVDVDRELERARRPRVTPAGENHRLGRRRDAIGLAELPGAGLELGRRRQIPPRPLRRAAADPSDHRVELVLAQTPRVAEGVETRVGLPRRHASGEQLLLDRRRPRSRAGRAVGAVGAQIDVAGRRPAGAVTDHAVAAQDRPHVLAPGQIGGDAHVRGGRRRGQRGERAAINAARADAVRSNAAARRCSDLSRLTSKSVDALFPAVAVERAHGDAARRSPRRGSGR